MTFESYSSRWGHQFNQHLFNIRLVNCSPSLAWSLGMARCWPIEPAARRIDLVIKSIGISRPFCLMTFEPSVCCFIGRLLFTWPRCQGKYASYSRGNFFILRHCTGSRLRQTARDALLRDQGAQEEAGSEKGRNHLFLLKWKFGRVSCSKFYSNHYD